MSPRAWLAMTAALSLAGCFDSILGSRRGYDPSSDGPRSLPESSREAGGAGAAGPEGGVREDGASREEAAGPDGATGLQVWVGESQGRLETCFHGPTQASDAVRRRVLLVLDLKQGEALAAKIVFGRGEPPSLEELVDPSQSLCPLEGPVEGFEYPTRQLRLHAGRLDFQVPMGSPYESWCLTRTSQPAKRPTFTSPAYVCGPPAMAEEESPSVVAQLCDTHRSPCECDEQRCWGTTLLHLVFDVQIGGDWMEGRIGVPGPTGKLDYRTEVRLHRELR
ncbi:MAG: hypothetical protein OXR73_16855 [Myxococcales bacterium]|nr:hypothetical protein [Myxococcales bacterium]